MLISTNQSRTLQFRRAFVEKWSALKPKIPEEPASHEMIKEEPASHEIIKEDPTELNDDTHPLTIKKENNMSNALLETNL